MTEVPERMRPVTTQRMVMKKVPSWPVLSRIPVLADAAHKSKAGNNAGHRIVGMNFVLEIYETFVAYGGKRFKNLLHRHDAFSHFHLALLAPEVREVLHVHVKEARARLAA